MSLQNLILLIYTPNLKSLNSFIQKGSLELI